jgi:hypothetical protein
MFLAETQADRNPLEHERPSERRYFHEASLAARIIRRKYHLPKTVAIVVATEAGFKEIAE